MNRRPCKYAADINGSALYGSGRCVDADDAKAQLVRVYGSPHTIRILAFRYMD